MTKRTGGLKRKSRYKLKKDRGTKGKISVNRFMHSFKEGQRVHLSIEPSVHKGSYHSRFIGSTGIVRGKRGKCFEVSINDKGKEKLLIVHPIHLREAKG